MAEQYRRAKELFLAVCDLSPAARTAALDAECGDDQELRAEVESLLAHYDGRTATVDDSAAVAADKGREGTPQRIGHYRVLERIGSGGMGVVYAGTHDELGRRVALKVFRRGMDTEEVLRRFDIERRAIAGMNHPGIARLL